MIAFMRALSNQIVGEKAVRCNAVAPGPIWTPLMCVLASWPTNDPQTDAAVSSPATMSKESIEKFGVTVPMGRAGQPIEVATAFVYLTSADSSYIRYASRFLVAMTPEY